MAEAELNRQIVVIRARVVVLRAVGTDVAVAEADTLDATAVAMDLGVRGLQEAAVVRQQMGRDADAAAVQAAADLRAARALIPIPVAPVVPAVGVAPLNPQAGAGGGPQQAAGAVRMQGVELYTFTANETSAALTGTACRQWVLQMDSAAAAARIDDVATVNYAVMYLRGPARLWYDQELTEHNQALNGWQAFRTILLERFDRRLSETTKAQLVRGLKQKQGEMCDNYFDRCRMIVNHVTAHDIRPDNVAVAVWPDLQIFQRSQMRLAAFTAGIHARYREELVSNRIVGEEAVREAVRGYEEGDLERRANAGGARANPVVAELEAMAEAEIAAVTGRGRGRGRGRGGRGGTTTTPAQNNAPAARGAGRGRGRGGRGRGGATPPAPTSGAQTPDDLDPRNYGCFICGSSQHLQKHCPELAKGKEQMTFATFKEKLNWEAANSGVAAEPPVAAIVEERARGAQGGHNPGYNNAAYYGKDFC